MPIKHIDLISVSVRGGAAVCNGSALIMADNSRSLMWIMQSLPSCLYTLKPPEAQMRLGLLTARHNERSACARARCAWHA